MKRIHIGLFFIISSLFFSVSAKSQSFETRYARPVHDIMQDVSKRFGVKLKFDSNVDTVGVMLPYADFRVRPYSLEQTLDNICKYYDWNWWKQNENTYKIKLYEYPRRHDDEGRQMLDWLSSKYSNKEEWEQRRAILIKEVRERLQIDAFLDSCVKDKPAILSKIRKHDGYTTQNICLELTPGQHVFGTIYSPSRNKSNLKSQTSNLKPLIICPDGHWPSRYRDDEQQRLATLARMGAICVDFDLYGYSQSAAEVGDHHTARAHIFQAACGLKLLDWMLKNRTDIDTTRVAANGGSGGGTHTVLLALLDNRITASAPVVHVASHFDGGCPCESGMPVQLAGGGTCEAELAAIIAPKPLLLVSDGGDWTHTNPELEYPFIQRIFGFYDAKANVRNVHLPDERHDFGPNKRQAVYEFFADVFGLDREMIDESKVTIESPETMQTKIAKP
ncbi:MAG: hypothetical protein IKQ59_15080 [Prevotella sp.]|nr:hypothetical protein [Prevotella sp.]